ncbi:MAG: PEP-CTERM sorting domain-containing protein [Luteolibacter sp.]
MKTKNKVAPLAATLIAFLSLAEAAMAQTYTAKWSTLSGSDGDYSVTMQLSSGSAINGVSSYTLKISNDNGRMFFDNGSTVLTSGPYTADVALESNTFGVAGNPFADQAMIATSDVLAFTNITGIKGRLQNPSGSVTTTFPIDLGETESASMSWTSQQFGFQTLRLNPDGPIGGTNIWDEWTMGVSQTWTATPVPEPSSILLCGFGGLALIIRRRK